MSLTAGLGVASLAGQVISNLIGARANRASQNLLDKQREENESFYNRNVNQDFLQTNAAKGMFEQLRKNFRDANKVAENTAAVTGATPEAEIAAKSKAQENYNDAVNNIAQKATGYQQNQEAIYRGEKARLNDQQIAVNNRKAENASNVAANAADVMGSATAVAGFDTLNSPKTPEEGISEYNRGRIDQIAKSPFRV